MAKKRAAKKTGKKAPLRKGGHKKQAKKPVSRKKPLASARKARKKTPRARKPAARPGMTARESAALDTILKSGMD